MRSIKVDKRWLVDSFKYYEYLEQGEFGDPIYKDPLLVNRCRVDYSTSFSRNADEISRNIQAIIFCYASATTPFMRFKKQSKVIIDGEEYIIQKVIINKEPQRSQVWSYELELV